MLGIRCGAPGDQRLGLRIGHGAAVLGVPIVLADLRPLQERQAGRLAGGRLREEQRQARVRRIGLGKRLLENRQQVFLSAFRRGADEDELADQPSVLRGDLLGDAAAEGKAQQVDFGEAEQVDEVDRVSGHRRDIVGRLTGRAADPGIVEGDHGAIGGEGVDDGGIPRIDVAREVLQENQRRSGRRAEPAIGEADSAALRCNGWVLFPAWRASWAMSSSVMSSSGCLA